VRLKTLPEGCGAAAAAAAESSVTPLAQRKLDIWARNDCAVLADIVAVGLVDGVERKAKDVVEIYRCFNAFEGELDWGRMFLMETRRDPGWWIEMSGNEVGRGSWIH